MISPPTPAARLRSEVSPGPGPIVAPRTPAEPTLRTDLETHRVRPALPGEAPRRLWAADSLFVDVLPSHDLGNSSFVVGDRKRKVAAVIDPTRDVGRYLDRLDTSRLALRWVLDTHLHADFLSGGSELARLAGATLALSGEADTRIAHRPLSDGDEIELGSGSLTVVKSPGHTPEHLSYLLRDAEGRDQVLFSGGSLMAGSAGRPDLLGASRTHRQVRDQFETLHHRFSSLPSAVAVLPTHTGGSFCGVGTRPTARTTLGAERKTNPLLLARDLRGFSEAYLSATPYPRYYGVDRRINETESRPLGREIPDLPGLNPADFEQLRRQPGTTVLDIRRPRAFATGHVPGSLSVPFEGALTAWVGWLCPPDERFVLVDDGPVSRRAAQLDLLRIGYDGLEGYLRGGIAGYAEAGHLLASTARTSMRSLRQAVERGDRLTLLDVRHRPEAAGEHIPGSVNIPLPELAETAPERLDRDHPVYVHCQSGFRAGIAASILERLGFPDVRQVGEGPAAWRVGRSIALTPRRRGRA